MTTVDSKSGAKFFGGNADEPFFLDDTVANRFVASSLANPGRPDTSLLGFRRGRDTYAGFNTLITAVSIPASYLRDASTSVIGVNAVTQRRMHHSISAGAYTGKGTWVNVDRAGNTLDKHGLPHNPRRNA